MEVDGGGSSSSAIGGEKSVMAPSGTQSSVSLTLHPLVLMNMADHWSRTRAQNPDSPPPVMGALLGKQKGRELELSNSFELAILEVDGGVVMDKEFFTGREAAYKEVFPELETLGWYRLGDVSATEEDVRLQRQFSDLSEAAPVFLAMAPGSRPSDQLPIALFESVVEAKEGGSVQLSFLALNYTLAQEEAERIAVDHIARVSSSAGASGASASAAGPAKTLSNELGAVRMLGERLKILLEWVEAVSSGSLPMDQEILREVAALTHRLPVASSKEFESELRAQCNDVALLSYLGALSKTYGSLNSLVSKLNVLYDRHGHHSYRRGRHIPL